MTAPTPGRAVAPPALAAVRPPTLATGPKVAPPSALFRTSQGQPWRRGVLLVGPPKVGKTTAAGGAPAPVFIQADEAGLSVLPDDMPHAVPTAWDRSPSSPADEVTVIGAVRSLLEGEHDYQTAVIDTVNRVELLLWRWICKVGQVDSIEAFGGGYGKGYTRALEEVNRLIDMLHALKSRRGMHWIAISHQTVKAAKDPTQDDYERAMMQLNEKAAGAWEGAVDTIIYCQPEIQTTDHINKDQKGERRKVEITGRTIAMVKPGRGIAAGSRDLVRSPMILSWAEYERQAKAGAEMKRALFAKRAGLTIEDQAALDQRLAAAGWSWDAYEAEVASAGK